MLEFYRIYISNIYVNKSNYKSKKCDFTITGIFQIKTLLISNMPVMVVMI